MSYAVKEIYLTLQGEGAHAGRPAVFLRFAGCNLWTGLERDRAAAVCRFCDTDFVGVNGPGGGRYADAGALAEAVAAFWPGGGVRYVVCTGGEPLLQLDVPLIRALSHLGFAVGVETNGTQEAPPGLDWICVSPKGAAPLKLLKGDELKLVYPQSEPQAQPHRFKDMRFTHFFLQPLDTGDMETNQRHINAAIAYCLNNPQWRLSLQTHKLLNIP